MHRRRKTLSFNPSLPNHCGYQAVLRAAGYRASITQVKWLRKRVSEEFYKARIESRSIAGVDPHQLLVQEGKSLAAYCREIAEEQWASIVELGLASEILETPLWYCADSYIRLGEGVPSHAVHKRGSHYVLQKMHKKKSVENPEDPAALHRNSVSRGGMHQQTSAAITVSCSELGFGVEEVKLQRTHHMDILAVRASLAYMAQVLRDHVELTVPEDDKNVLPDWLGPPDHIRATLIPGAKRYYRLLVLIPDRRAQFLMQVGYTTPIQLIEDHVAAVVGVLPQFIALHTREGDPWRPVPDASLQKVYLAITGRAGVRDVTFAEHYVLEEGAFNAKGEYLDDDEVIAFAMVFGKDELFLMKYVVFVENEYVDEVQLLSFQEGFDDDDQKNAKDLNLPSLQRAYHASRERAGVRTVSSTQPYAPDQEAAFAEDEQLDKEDLIPCLEECEEQEQNHDDYDPEPDEQWRRHMVESAASGRSRSRTRRTRTPQRERSRSRDDEVRAPQRPDLSWRRQFRQAADLHRRDDSRSRTSARSRDRSVESSIARRSASPTRHSWTSRATPANLPAAQHHPVCKPVLEGDTPVGHVWADPAASAVEVVISMHRELKIAVAIDTIPQHANLWTEVTRLNLGERKRFDLPYLKDLRVTRWELYQSPRLIPVLHQGEVVETILVSTEIPMEKVQRRIELWRTWRLTYNLIALDCYTWVALRNPLPRLAIDCIEILTRRAARPVYPEAAPERAGMRPNYRDAATQMAATRHTGTQTIWMHAARSPTYWDDQQFVILWLIQAHDPMPTPIPWVANVSGSAGELRNALAAFWGEHC